MPIQDSKPNYDAGPSGNNEQQSRNRLLESIERKQLWFNGILAACGVIGLFITTYQGCSLKEANQVAARAADAAYDAAVATKKSNQIATDNAERQLRAYVTIDKAHMIHGEAGVSTAFFELKNSGQTPAKDVHFKPRRFYTDRPHTEPSSEDFDVCIPGSRSVIGQGIVIEVPVPMTITKENFPLLISGSRRLWVSGEITYKDVFSKNRRTWFRVYAEIIPKGKGMEPISPLLFATEGNGME